MIGVSALAEPVDLPPRPQRRAVRRVRPPWAIGAIVVVAAVLRFSGIGGVAGDPFYDASVRSMSLSLHNFLFGAFDPGGILAVDKPPLDLWLQVLSVKLFGWGSFALKLPEALAGTAAVAVLYDVVRRTLGRPAGLAAAAALAVLPESVLTARSDTMDSVMMLLVLVALWLVVRASDSGRRATLVLAGVAMGLAFNVKLFQALLPLPAFALLYWLAAPRARSRSRRAGDLACAGGALILVGLAWAIIVSLAPGHHPWAVSSSDGSVWNAMFVFNGIGRVGGPALSHRPGGPGPLRLLVSTGWHYDLLFGCVLLASLVIAAMAALVALRGHQLTRRSRVFVLSLAVWVALGILVFDTMTTVHARYLEALSPALASLIGWGATFLAGLGEGDRRPVLGPIAFALALSALYTVSLDPSAGRGSAALVLAAVGAALLARAQGTVGLIARWATATLIVASLLVFPVHESVSLVRAQANDSLGTATASPADVLALSRYLRPRTGGLRYELAVDDPLALAPLIIRDQRGILPLTSWGGRPLTGLSALRDAISRGEVRYGLLGAYRCGAGNRTAAACGPAARWIRRHGTDVSAAAGLSGHSHLYRLPGTS